MPTKKQIERLYSLAPTKSIPLFLSFDPADFDDADGYSKNKAFLESRMQAMLVPANIALRYFTRANSTYETNIINKNTYKSRKDFLRSQKKGEVDFVFSMSLFQAFKRDKRDFEEAVKFCLELLCNCLDPSEHSTLLSTGERTGVNDLELLYRSLLIYEAEHQIKYKTSTGSLYGLPHLLAVFSLWKIDKAIEAIKNDLCADTANLLVDALRAISISEHYSSAQIYSLSHKKNVSEKNAEKAAKSPKGLEPLKEQILSIYDNKETKWPSRDGASKLILKQLRTENFKISLSQEEEVTTVSSWLKKHDPDGAKLKLRKK